MITVFGASGFIGSYLVKRLVSMSLPYYAPLRNEDISSRHLGQIIYCIGLTADFRQRPLETVNAHICKVLEVIRTATYDSFLYLSSTRLYQNLTTTDEMNDLNVNPSNFNDLYNISKLMGETLILHGANNGKVVRLSNVYGLDVQNDETFLSSILQSAVLQRNIVLKTSLEAAKDYVNIADVADMLLRIAAYGKSRIYNVASGLNVTNFELMSRIAELTRCHIEVESQAPTVIFPPINIQRIQDEFQFQPTQLLNNLEEILTSYKSRKVD